MELVYAYLTGPKFRHRVEAIIEKFSDMREDLDRLIQAMLERGITFEDAQKEFERLFIARALAKSNFNVCKAAKITGLHRNTLSRKITSYKIRKAG